MKLRILLIATAVMALALPAHAGPDGAQVVGGSATVHNPGSANVTVNQFSDKAIINWRMFDIGTGERTTFNQPSSSSIALNRVTGGMGPSQILGSLDANGKVFVVNRDGIIFGAGAVINTAGFLATTSDIRNEDFMAGRFNFQIPGRPDASIVNMGRITATSGGFAALVAPGVRNTGTVTADFGSIGLAAGNTFSLDFYGDKLITLGVNDQIASQVKDVASGETLKSLVTNTGKLSANGGRVELTAAAARQVVDSVINTTGVIEANSVGLKNGQIVLSAATADTKGAAPRQSVRVSGSISAAGRNAGTKGGKVVITGENIELVGAGIDASGRAGGGTVLIGGDRGGGKPNRTGVNNQSAALEANAIPNATTVSVDAATAIDASARDSGDGGKVVLWANDRLSFGGTILALGGREFGNGGFVETSGKTLDVWGSVNAGRGGTWLLDPANLIVDTTLAASIQLSLNSGNDVIQETSTFGAGDGDIIFNSGVRIEWNTSATLTLIAFRNIQFNDGAFGSPPGNLVNTGAGHLVMRADSTGTGFGTLVMGQTTNATRVNWSLSTGTISLYYNPTAFGTQDNFTSGSRIILATPSQLTQYMLVNTPANLQAIGTNASTLSQNYALGPINLDMTGLPFLPIGGAGDNFTGRFDGLNNTISNLTIAPTAASATSVSIGLFGSIGATGHVNNLFIDNASVTANPNVTGPGQFIGVVAGSNGGTIGNVFVTSSTVSHGVVQNGIVAGGLVGQNGIFGPGGSLGAITLSTAEVNVTVGNASSGSSGNSAGGLVGGNPGTITNSFAVGDVSGGANSFIGGLVGRNEVGATISGSGAAGSVNLPDTTGSGAGGLVGFNFGTIDSSFAVGNVTGGASSDIFKAGGLGGFVGFNDAGGQITSSVAGGNVSGGAMNSVGGFVGFNNGTISSSGAVLGSVTAQDNFAGGFAGFNTGTISFSTAAGNVSGGGFSVGGFVGDNAGTITNSSAIGTVTAITTPTSPVDGTTVGGFAGSNRGNISDSQSFSNVSGLTDAGGFVGSNDNSGSISNSIAFGSVTVGNNATAGGFVSGNHGEITNSQSGGAVSGGHNSILGGFVAGNFGTITFSSASGNVASTGANSVAGGFAGVSFDTIANSTASGAVSGTSESYLGGFVGINANLIQDSTAGGNVTGSGAHNFVGGFAGVNFGFIDPSQSSGNASSGENSIVGGFIGANAALQFPDGFQTVGTISPGSGGTGTASGGSGSTVGEQVGQSYPVAGLPDLPTRVCDGGLCGGTLFNPNGPQDPVSDIPISDKPISDIPTLSPQLTVTANLVKDSLEPKTTDEVVNTSTSSGNTPSGSPGGRSGGSGGRPAGNQVPPPGLGPLPSGMPPPNETRFLDNEVVMQLGLTLTRPQVEDIARRNGLEIIASETFGLLGRTVYRFRITGGAAVRSIISTLQAISPNISTQPSYTFMLDQGSAAPADTNRQGDSAQYIVTKLRLAEAHAIATGKNVKVAVIDSEIDGQHPDLKGVIAATYDALPSNDQTPHPHGTGMAGAIASNQRLLGVAPGAKLLAIRAFGVSNDGAQGTSMNIVKGLEWAVKEGAQVINMSFAGPRDPILEQAVKALKDRGVILIAAAGNAGPKSPPLFPGADPNVIAVSATDAEDGTYKNANRGKYVAIAAPGVDILVPAPEGGYQLTTGTSVAAAHISGVVAMLLERNGRLSPAEVRSILAASAKKLPQGRNDIGAGLVDPVQALSRAGPKSAQAR